MALGREDELREAREFKDGTVPLLRAVGLDREPLDLVNGNLAPLLAGIVVVAVRVQRMSAYEV